MSGDLIQETIDSLHQALFEIQKDLTDPSVPQNLKLASSIISELKYLFVQRYLNLGIKQKDIAKMLNVTPGRISQIKSEIRVKNGKRFETL